MFALTTEEKLRKATKDIIRDRHAYIAAGTVLMGESTIVDNIPTACTDGRNKKYGRQFIDSLAVEELAGIVLHEAVHILLRHIPRHRDLMKEDARLTNIAMDFADNDFIRSLPSYGTTFKLPEGHLYDAKYKGWTVRQIYNDLKQEQESGGSGNDHMETLDEHDLTMWDKLDEGQKAELDKRVTQAIQEASILSGINNSDTPRQITELLEPEINWRDQLTDFMNSTMRGADDKSFRKFNRKRLIDDLYMPTDIAERVGDVVVAIDTSGSIGDRQVAEFAGFLSTLCDQVNPDSVTVLWWDTQVHGQQVFTDKYDNVREMLKPMGGGGTQVSCVAQYINDKRLSADCIIVFTDGYVEDKINWNVNVPTLWLVTQKTDFVPPSGYMVKFK